MSAGEGVGRSGCAVALRPRPFSPKRNLEVRVGLIALSVGGFLIVPEISCARRDGSGVVFTISRKDGAGGGSRIGTGKRRTGIGLSAARLSLSSFLRFLFVSAIISVWSRSRVCSQLSQILASSSFRFLSRV